MNILKATLFAMLLTTIGATGAAAASACSDDLGDDEMIATCTKIIDNRTNAPQARASAYRNRAFLKRHEHLDEALGDMDNAIKLLPKHAPYYADRADLQEQEEQYSKVIDDLTRAIELDPKQIDYLLSRSSAYGKSDQGALQLADIDRAIELFPGNERGYMARASYFKERGDYKEALRDYNVFVKVSKNLTSAYLMYGQLRTMMNEPDGAIKDLTIAAGHLEADKSKKHEPPSAFDAMIYGLRGLNYFNLGNYDLALSDFSKGIVGYDHEVIRQLRGMTFAAKQQYELAIEDYTAAIQKHPSVVATYFLRADVYEKIGRKKAATADRINAALIGSGLKEQKK